MRLHFDDLVAHDAHKRDEDTWHILRVTGHDMTFNDERWVQVEDEDGYRTWHAESEKFYPVVTVGGE